MRPSISICIAVYNCCDLTKACLESVIPTLGRGDEVLVYDNGSIDKTQSLLKRWKKKPFFRMIKGEENKGFVYANNELIKIARPNNDLLLLNNDTEIPIGQEKWMDVLSERLYAHEDAGIMSCRQFNRDRNTLVSCGSETLPNLFGWNRAGSEEDVNQFPDEEEVEKTNFACVLILREALRSLENPFLDEDVFAYTEDDRMILRMRQAGWKTYYTPKVMIYHTPNSTSKANQELIGSDIHRKSHATFVEKWGQYYKDKKEIAVNLKSLLIRPPGYASACKNLIRGLEEVDVDVYYDYLLGTMYMEGIVKGDEYVRQVQKTKPTANGRMEILFQMADMAKHNSSRLYKILYTMLEVNSLPDEWVKGCNLVDEVWVPDSFNVKTFKEAGVTKPIYMMPLGIDKNYFHPDIKPMPLRYRTKTNFVIVGEWGNRKNMELAIRCFKKAFDQNTDVSLTLKIHYNGPEPGHPRNVLKDKMTYYHSLNGPPVLINVSVPNDMAHDPNKYFPAYKMGSFYRAFDLFVNLSSGEGSDLPAKEALACGVPVLRNSYSAFDFLVDEERKPLPGVLLTDHKLVFPGKTGCPYYNCKESMRWGGPVEEDVIKKFREAYKNIEQLKEQAKETSNLIREKYDIRICAKRIKERLLEIDSCDLVNYRRRCLSEEKNIIERIQK